MDLSKFYVVTPYSNHVRYRSRRGLFLDFQKRMTAAGVNLSVAELAFGRRPFVVTDPTNKLHVQLRTQDEMWHKENIINIAISRLPADWQYVAWIDGDVSFDRLDWAQETVHQLQHYEVVQMWQSAVDMGPQGQAMNTFQSFASCYLQGLPLKGASTRPGPYYYAQPSKNGAIYWHPGFAWAANRSAIDGMGGLLDRAILGAADHHMALCMINRADLSLPSPINGRYSEYVLNWQLNAERFVRRDIGFVPGTILHHWHGKKVDRKYWDRWKVLQKWDFDPVRDLKRDWQGLYQVVDDGSPRSIGLRDGLRQYFRSRNEDSIDLE